MPKRKDIKKILVIGAGPIIIGQACEFDYSGTQACKALKDEGYKVILVNSNPATIMTDPGVADKTYIEPITLEVLEEVLKKEKPSAILPTMGGQTALNLAINAEKPVIASKWSGHIDFLTRDSVLLPGDLINVPKDALPKEFRVDGAQWFRVNYQYAKSIFQDVHKNYQSYLMGAKKQSIMNKTKFSLDAMTEKLDKILTKHLPNFDIQPAPQKVDIKLPKLKKVKQPSKIKLPKLKKVN